MHYPVGRLGASRTGGEVPPFRFLPSCLLSPHPLSSSQAPPEKARTLFFEVNTESSSSVTGDRPASPALAAGHSDRSGEVLIWKAHSLTCKHAGCDTE